MKETLENIAFRGNPIDGWINRLPGLQKWLARNEYSIVLAFYNTGTEVFIEPSREPVDTFYSKNWLLVEHEAFKRMGRIMFHAPKAVGKQRKKKPQNTIRFCHSGHTQDGRALVNFNHGIKLKKFEKRGFDIQIHKGQILFIAVFEGRIQSHCIFRQFLPMRLFSDHEVGLTPVVI